MPWSIRLLCLLSALAVSCEGCSHSAGDAPDDHTWRAVTDPYPALVARGSESDHERAAKAVERVAQELGYPGAAEEFRARRNEAWVVRESLLLAHGGNDQVDAAWIDALGSLVESSAVPPELKLLLRQSEARVLDAKHAKVAPDVLKRMQLGELAWMLHLLARLRADAGLPAPRGF